MISCVLVGTSGGKLNRQTVKGKRRSSIAWFTAGRLYVDHVELGRAVFEWDEDKSQRNLAERGFDFAFAARIFEGDTIEREDSRQDYGERRVVAIGRVEGFTLTVVYTPRGDT
jgi:uncharacterized protein